MTGLANSTNGGMINPNVTYSGTLNSLNIFYFNIVSTILNSVFYGNLIQATLMASTEPLITTLDLGNVQALGTFSPAMTGLTTLTASNLEIITTGFQPTLASVTTINMPALISIAGNLTIPDTVMTSLSLPNVLYIGGNITQVSNALLTLSLPKVTTIGGISVNTLIQSVDFTSLVYVGALSFSVQSNALTTLTIPALTTSAGITIISSALTTLTLPALANVLSKLLITANSITSLTFPALIQVGSLGGISIAITAANLVTCSMGNTLKSLAGNFICTGAALNQASVDSILVSLAALDGTSGTTAWSSLTVNLSGGTSSAPSATGLAAKATLVARSCTVTTN